MQSIAVPANNLIGGRSVEKRIGIVGFLNLCLLCSIAFTAPTMVKAEPEKDRVILPPHISRFVGTSVIEKAYREVPLSCRKELQAQLTRQGFLAMDPDGRWSDQITDGVIDFVRATGPGTTLVYNLQTVSGAKGLIWSIALFDTTCPTPPYDS